MNRLWTSIRHWYVDLTVAMAEAAMARLVEDLPQMRKERAALAERMYALEMDEPA